MSEKIKEIHPNRRYFQEQDSRDFSVHKNEIQLLPGETISQALLRMQMDDDRKLQAEITELLHQNQQKLRKL